MPYVSVVNNLFEKENHPQSSTQDNREAETNKEEAEDTENNEG